MKFKAIWAAAVMLAFGGLAWADITASVHSVTESRNLILLDGADAMPPHHLRINFTFHGAELKEIRKVGRWVIEQAADDQGANLVEAPLPVFANRMYDMPQHAFKKGENTLPLWQNLKAPSRQATRINLLKGTVTFFLGGEKKEGKIEKLRGLIGKQLEHEALRAANVTLTLQEIKDGQWRSGVVLEMRGDPDTIDTLQIEDEKGKKVSETYTTYKEGGGVSYRLLVANHYQESQSLRFTVTAGHKVLVVPFELKEIPLP